MNTIVYEKYSDKYEDDVINLLNVCFKNKDINKTSFKWKHFDKYFQAKQKAMIALDGKAVVAFVCFTPLAIVGINSTCRFFSCSVQATHPNYRRRGLIKDLTLSVERLLPKGVNYLGFSNKSGIKIDLHSKNINYQILGQMVTKYMLSVKSNLDMSVKVVSNLDNVFLNDEKLYGYEISKDFNYLDWRYYRNPKNKFNYLEFINKEQTVGYAVVKNKFPKCEILCVKSKNPDNLGNCINLIRSYAIKNCLFITSFTYLPNGVWDELLTRYFFQKKSGIYFTVKTSIKSFLNSENWIIQGGDVQ